MLCPLPQVKKYTLNLTDLELKVEDATSAETWGPHGSTMNGAPPTPRVGGAGGSVAATGCSRAAAGGGSWEACRLLRWLRPPPRAPATHAAAACPPRRCPPALCFAASCGRDCGRGV